MIDDAARVVAPVLRGYGARHGIGPVVQRSETLSNGNNEALTLPAPIQDQDREEYIDALLNALSASAAAEGLPRVVTIDGQATLLIGQSLDDVDRTRKEASSGEPLSGGRIGARTDDEPDPASDAVHSRRSEIMAGRISVVTGAAQGFGENIARELARAGAFVVLADMNVGGAQKVAEELNRELSGTVAVAMQVDVSDEASVQDLINTIVDTFGGIDLFISNAGVLRAKPVRELDLESFEFVTNVNYKGFFLCTKHASDVMALQNRGFQAAVQARSAGSAGYYTDIIQINSKSGLEGSNKNAAYAGSKFGGIGLVQSFAKELIEDSIKVNAVCPGNFFDGPLWSDPEKGLFVQYLHAGKVEGAKTVEDVKRAYESKVPFGRGCRAEDVVRAIYYIVEQEYETGQAVPVTGGQVMMR